MISAPRARRRIEQVPCLLIGLLCDAGKLKRPPVPPAGVRGYREPGLEDYRALTWLVQWEGGPIDRSGMHDAAGAVGFHDHYDFHTASDVREILFLTGSPRAVHDLIQAVRKDAEDDRRVIGMIGVDNPGLAQMLDAMGFPQTRYMFEDNA